MIGMNPNFIVKFKDSPAPLYIAEMIGAWNRWTQDPKEALRKTASEWEKALASRGKKQAHYELVQVEDSAS